MFTLHLSVSLSPQEDYSSLQPSPDDTNTLTHSPPHTRTSSQCTHTLTPSHMPSILCKCVAACVAIYLLLSLCISLFPTQCPPPAPSSLSHSITTVAPWLCHSPLSPSDQSQPCFLIQHGSTPCYSLLTVQFAQEAHGTFRLMHTITQEKQNSIVMSHLIWCQIKTVLNKQMGWSYF